VAHARAPGTVTLLSLCDSAACFRSVLLGSPSPCRQHPSFWSSPPPPLFFLFLLPPLPLPSESLHPVPGPYGIMKGPGNVASPRLQGFRDWISGQVGPLPITSGDTTPAPQATCTPACVWGACGPSPTGQGAGRCQCFAGASGATCATLGAKPSDCVSPGASHWDNVLLGLGLCGGGSRGRGGELVECHLMVGLVTTWCHLSWPPKLSGTYTPPQHHQGHKSVINCRVHTRRSCDDV
jgi:hypothetical protein